MTKLMKEGNDFVMGKQSWARLAVETNGRGEITVKIGYRRLYAVLPGSHSSHAAADGVIHPPAASLAGPRVEVQVEVADQFSATIAYSEKFHVGVPKLNILLHALDNDSIEILHQLEHARQYAGFREILLHFLIGKRIPVNAQLLARTGHIPCLQLFQP